MLSPPLQLTEDNYVRFRELIRSRTGLIFDTRTRQRDVLARGLLDTVERARCENLTEYYRLLEQSTTDGELWDSLVAKLTVGETYFFRNPHFWNALRYHVLPGLVSRHRDDHRLRIWSAGCATGEEPYFVAML